MTTIYGGAQLLATRDLDGRPPARAGRGRPLEADRLYRLVEDLVVLVRSERDGIQPGRRAGRARSPRRARDRARRSPGTPRSRSPARRERRGRRRRRRGAGDARPPQPARQRHPLRRRRRADRGHRRGHRQPRSRSGSTTTGLRRADPSDGDPFALSADAAGDGGGAGRCRDRAVRRGPPRAGDGRPDVGDRRRLATGSEFGFALARSAGPRAHRPDRRPRRARGLLLPASRSLAAGRLVVRDPLPQQGDDLASSRDPASGGGSAWSSAASTSAPADRAVEVGVEDGRVDVAPAGDGRRVAEPIGGLADGLDDVRARARRIGRPARAPAAPGRRAPSRPRSGSPWR